MAQFNHALMYSSPKDGVISHEFTLITTHDSVTNDIHGRSMLWLSLFCCKQCSADRAENCGIVAVSHLTAVWFSCRKVKSHVMTAAMDIEPFMPGEVFLCQMSETSGRNEKNNTRFPSFSSRFAFLIN